MDREVQVFAVFALCGLAASWAAPPARGPEAPAGSAVRRRDDGRPGGGPGSAAWLYERTRRELGASVLVKPRAATPEPVRVACPLVLIERDDGDRVESERDERTVVFGAPRVREDGKVEVEAAEPVLWRLSDRVPAGSGTLPRRTWLWWYRRPRADGGPRGGWTLQGVREVLGDDGRALVREVLNDSAGARVLYVPKRVEEAARASFGPPPPSRRHAVERPVDETPEVVVARVLTDEPVPMGPWVYVPAGGLDVSTLLCRCMSSQMRGELESRAVAVRELPGDVAERVIPRLPGAGPEEPERPDALLRWPPGLRSGVPSGEG